MPFEEDQFNSWSNAEDKAYNAYELYEQGLLNQALDQLDSAIAINPSISQWHFNKGLTLDAMERFEEAINEYKQAIDLAGDDVEILNSLAVDYTRTGLYDLSIEIFEKIEQADPDFEPAYCNRIITYTEMEQHRKAEEMFYLAQQINAECPLCFYNIGNSLFARGNYEKSIWCWQRTAILEPTHPQINYRIAQAGWANGDIENAHEYFLTELRENPGNVDVTLDFGLFLLQQGKTESAKEKFNRILEINPDFAPALHYLGEIEFNCQNIEKAIDLFLLATEKAPQMLGPRFRLALCMMATEQTEKAHELLLSEVQLNPTNTEALLAIGSILMQIGELDTAVHCLLKVMDQDDNNVKAIYYLALALTMRNEYEDAMEFIDHALQTEPNNTDLLRASAMIHFKTGNLNDTIAALETVHSIDPEDTKTVSILKILRRKRLLRKIYARIMQIKTIFQRL